MSCVACCVPLLGLKPSCECVKMHALLAYVLRVSVIYADISLYAE
jgi:hypothetical protein